MNKKAVGLIGQNLVEKYLQKDGFTILERNFLIRGGEIDLIVQKDYVIAFVEIKTRQIHFQGYTQAIGPQKQASVSNAALLYLARSGIEVHKHIIRFDVAFVINNNIEYLPNAFQMKIF